MTIEDALQIPQYGYAQDCWTCSGLLNCFILLTFDGTESFFYSFSVLIFIMLRFWTNAIQHIVFGRLKITKIDQQLSSRSIEK